MMARLLLAIAILTFAAGCDSLPGKPTLEERWKPASEVTDFSRLYAQNCAGCHGADGSLGPARPLKDSLYLALAGASNLRIMIADGVPGTSSPAFAKRAGGNLTDKQINILVGEMLSRWGAADQYRSLQLPPYSIREAIATGSGPGDPQRGAVAYQSYCATCHGVGGAGGPRGGSVVDPAYLALVSDQALRTVVIVGRRDLGMPDWREYVPGRPMGPQEISDVVAWLASHRQPEAISQTNRGK